MRSLLAQSGVLRDVIIIVISLVAVWVGLQAYFGTQNPFYVVSSGSMVPELEMYDILVVSGNSPFGGVEIGDIIVFNRPSDHDRVIVHRVVAVADEDPRTLRTKGDANPSSIPGTDFPITAEDYIGSVVYVIPQAGYITRVLSPPVNYIIIAVIVGVMVTKHLYGRRAGGEGDGERSGPGDGGAAEAQGGEGDGERSGPGDGGAAEAPGGENGPGGGGGAAGEKGHAKRSGPGDGGAAEAPGGEGGADGVRAGREVEAQREVEGGGSGRGASGGDAGAGQARVSGS